MNLVKQFVKRFICFFKDHIWWIGTYYDNKSRYKYNTRECGRCGKREFYIKISDLFDDPVIILRKI